MQKILLVAPLFAVIVACSGDGRSDSVFWDGDGDVRGTDVRSDITERDLDKLVIMNDAVVVVHITGIEESKRFGQLPVNVKAEDPADQGKLDENAAEIANLPTATTYSGEVERWLKGTGGKEIAITASGGLLSDGSPSFVDGFFLLEPGRTYLLLLAKNADGNYQCCWARTGFDLTDGVKVLDHPDTRDLEHFEDMSVDDFVSYIKQLADSTGTAAAAGN